MRNDLWLRAERGVCRRSHRLACAALVFCALAVPFLASSSAYAESQFFVTGLLVDEPFTSSWGLAAWESKADFAAGF